MIKIQSPEARAETTLAICLALIAGYADAYGLIALGTYVSFMSGNTRCYMARLKDVCRYIRSKNAGPFWITLDLFFDGEESYARYRDTPTRSPEAVARIYVKLEAVS